MSRSTILSGLAGLVMGVGVALAPSQAYAADAPKYTADTPSQCTPHYLKGMKRPKDRLKNMLEKERVYSSMLNKYPARPRAKVNNGSEIRRRTIHGVNVKMVFPNYVQYGDVVRHYNSEGVDTYSLEEFGCVVEHNAGRIRQGAFLAMKDYTELLENVLPAKEKALREAGKLKDGESLEDYLKRPVPGYPGITYGDTEFIPDTSIQDFVPTEYFFGEIPALGVTYLNTGIIGMDPKAIVLDHINRWPTIMVHEMTHRNPKLQVFPLTSKVDPELWASFPMLVHQDMGRFLGHPYLKPVHKVAKILRNFDNRLAYVHMIKRNLVTGVEFDYAKAKEYHEKVQEISAEIRDVAFNKYIPAVFADPLYVMAFNDFMKDDNAFFKLVMYMNFEPTLLGGPEKTRDFIQENSDVIKSTSETVLHKLNDDFGKEPDEGERHEIRRRVKERLQSMDEQQKMILLSDARAFGLKTRKLDDLIDIGIRLHRLGLIEFPYVEDIIE